MARTQHHYSDSGSPGVFDPQSSLQGGIHGVPRIEHTGVHPLTSVPFGSETLKIGD